VHEIVQTIKSQTLYIKQNLSALFGQSRAHSSDAKTMPKVTHVERVGHSWSIFIKFVHKVPNIASYKNKGCVALDNTSKVHTNLQRRTRHWSGRCKFDGGGLRM
jgi:hypothetical protein